MIERKIELERQLNECQVTINKTMDVFSKENYGQAVTQWNFTALRQVLNSSLTELNQKIMDLVGGYEQELQKLSLPPASIEPVVDSKDENTGG